MAKDIADQTCSGRRSCRPCPDLTCVSDLDPRDPPPRRPGEDFRLRLDDDGRTRHPARRQRWTASASSDGIPPAWTDVWIAPTERGHIQATGRDVKGRKQYRYHERWREVRDAGKFDRLIAFGRALPKLRAQVAHDLARRGLPREKVLAAVIRVMEITLIRVGNEEYAKTNKSFGLTSALRNRHAKVGAARGGV